VPHTAPVRSVASDRSNLSHQRPGQAPVPRFEYRIKEQKPIADPKKLNADAVVQIGKIEVPIKDAGKEPMVIEESIDVPSQKPVVVNDHEASSSKNTADKYHQPRWCPSGLTHTPKRKLQRLRNKEKKEQEEEKIRDEDFNRYRPMFPQRKVWKVKTADQPARPVGPPQPTGQTGPTALTNRSDWSSLLQSQQPNQHCPFRFLLLMKPQQFLRQQKTRNWWIMKHLRSAPTWRSMWCIYLQITSWFRRRTWLIFSLGHVKLCSRSRARRTTI